MNWVLLALSSKTESSTITQTHNVAYQRRIGYMCVGNSSSSTCQAT